MPLDKPPARSLYQPAGIHPADCTASPEATTQSRAASSAAATHCWSSSHAIVLQFLVFHFISRSSYFSESLDHVSSVCSISFISLFALSYIIRCHAFLSSPYVIWWQDSTSTLYDTWWRDDRVTEWMIGQHRMTFGDGIVVWHCMSCGVSLSSGHHVSYGVAYHPITVSPYLRNHNILCFFAFWGTHLRKIVTPKLSTSK